MTEAYSVDAVRTPRAIGKPGTGAFSKMHPQHLAATVLKTLRQCNELNTVEVDDIVCRAARAHAITEGRLDKSIVPAADDA